MKENKTRLEELKDAVCRLVCIAEDAICRKGFEELDNAGTEIIGCLEEIQQYRAIGTVEELKSLKENGAFSGIELAQIASMQMKLKEYQSIGTIEEFKVLKENQRKCEDCAGCTNWNCDCANVRDKAVDEFAERLSNKDNIVKFDIDEVMSSGNFDYNCDCLRRYIDKIAEEMRGAE